MSTLETRKALDAWPGIEGKTTEIFAEETTMTSVKEDAAIDTSHSAEAEIRYGIRWTTGRVFEPAPFDSAGEAIAPLNSLALLLGDGGGDLVMKKPGDDWTSIALVDALQLRERCAVVGCIDDDYSHAAAAGPAEHIHNLRASPIHGFDILPTREGGGKWLSFIDIPTDEAQTAPYLRRLAIAANIEADRLDGLNATEPARVAERA
jgi:hypothetical protein